MARHPGRPVRNSSKRCIRCRSGRLNSRVAPALSAARSGAGPKKSSSKLGSDRAPRPCSAEEENQWLLRQYEVVRQEQDSLRKVAPFFANDRRRNSVPRV